MTAPEARARFCSGLVLSLLLPLLSACDTGREETRPTPIPEPDTAPLGAVARTAIEDAYKAALAAPDAAERVGRYAMILHAYGQTTPAERAYLRAMALDPSASRWVVYRGLIQFDRSEYREAVATFEAGDPEARQPAVQVYLARAEAAAGDEEAAIARLERIMARYPQRVDALLERARLAMITDKPAAAADLYRRALAIRDGLAEAHYGLAQALRAQGDTHGAELQLAAFEASQGSAFLAEDDPRRAIAAAIESERTHVENSKRALARGDFDEARQALERARAMNPDNLSTLTNLVVVYGRLGDVAQATEAYRAALEISPDYYNAHYNFGLVAAGAGRPREAERAFRLAAEADASRPEPFIEYGRLLDRAGQSQLALEQYRHALERDPESAAARFLLGQLLARLGDYQTASMHLERLVASDDPSVPAMMRVLAGVYGQSGDTERARATLAAARDRARSLGQVELATRLDEDLQRLSDGDGASAGD